VRTGVGVFDVSHLGRFSVIGPGALELIRSQLCNDVARITSGRAQYTMALNDRGGVEDDIIVWWLDEESFWVMPNGTNFDEILGRFEDAAAGCVVAPLRDESVLLAVQGPQAPAAVDAVLGWVPGRFRVGQASFAGETLRAAGTGYTGEKGVEIAAPVAVAADLLHAFLGAGCEPCGLGARDTLRLEMGYPLWGQDLDADTTPVAAGLGWVVSWDHDFIGRDALLAEQEYGPEKQLAAFRTAGRSIPRHGYRIQSGASTGTVSSGNYSPTLQCGIGLGYLSPPPASETSTLAVEIRGEWVEADLVTPPFIAP
jgi:aminomethyltransferase